MEKSASSILQKKSKLYGPKNAIDINNTTSSWNSEGIVTNNNGNNDDEDGNNQRQYLLVNFGTGSVRPKLIKLQFQAGFGCELCKLYFYNNTDNTTSSAPVHCMEFEAHDIHDIQIFDLLKLSSNTDNNINNSDDATIICTSMKLEFHNLVDFYGRIIVYKLEIWGNS